MRNPDATQLRSREESGLIATRYQFRKDFESKDIHNVTFDRMNSPFYEGERWAVRRTGSCLAKDGEWEYEPMPSNRDDEFYERCRFPSIESAIAAFYESERKTQPNSTRNDDSTESVFHTPK